MTDRELFIKAFVQADNVSIERFLDKAAFSHAFSDSFERKMARLISKDNRIRLYTRRRIMKALLAAMIAILVLIAGLMSVSASREAILKFITKDTETYLDISLDEESTPVPKGLNPLYIYTDIPEGFKQTMYEKTSSSLMVVWNNKDGEQIAFFQEALDTQMTIDNEHYFEETELNGFPAYITAYAHYVTYIFSDGQYWFTVSLPERYQADLQAIAEKVAVIQ